MKQIKREIVLLLILLFIYTLNAQEKSRSHGKIYAGTGISIPSAPESFKDGWNRGFNIEAGMIFPLSQDVIFQPGFIINQFPLNKKMFPENNVVRGGGLSILTITGNIKFLLNRKSSFNVYLINGIGFFSRSSYLINISGPGFRKTIGVEGEKGMAFAIGAGLRYQFNTKMSVFIEPSYLTNLTRGDTMHYFPIKIGIIAH